MEIDRQHIRRRITKLKRDIKDLARTRDVKRASRERSGIPQIAIAGYTNAGKSTLMRALTHADVIVADQLFATLDPTTRRIRLPNGRDATVSDTVGFVSKLPHDLVEAFRSTLEEVTRADMILHVADASSPDVERQIEAVRATLAEIGADGIVEVLAFNKIDLVDADGRARLDGRFPDASPISALTGEGVEALLEQVTLAIPRFPVAVRVLLPHERGDLVAMLHRNAEILSEEPGEDGVRIRARVGERVFAAVRAFVIDPERPAGSVSADSSGG